MTINSQNKILFLFNENLINKHDKNKTSFIFGNSETANPCVTFPYITDSNTVEINCGCSHLIDHSNNTIIISCGDDGEILPPIILDFSRGYIGASSTTAFMVDIPTIRSYVGLQQQLDILYVEDLRLRETYYFGIESNTIVVTSRMFERTFYFGQTSTSNILYEPYNTLIPPGATIVPYFGVTSLGSILYNPYNQFFKDGEYSSSHFGVASSDTKVVFDPYNLLFDETHNLNGYVGASINNIKVVFDPYNMFIDETRSVKGYVGVSSNNIKVVFDPYNMFIDEPRYYYFGVTSPNIVVVFDPYNIFDTTSTAHFGIQSSSTMRYSDDQYISRNEPINFFGGITSINTVKYANEFLAITARPYLGVTSTSIAKYQPGFMATGYVGTYSWIRWLRIGTADPIFMSCRSYFGVELHDNRHKPRYFDLHEQTCCIDTTNTLLNVEMTDVPDFDVRYGSDIGWSFKSSCVFTTQPRLTSTASFGITSYAVERETLFVDLGTVINTVGVSANTRSMTHSTSSDTGYGNFIIDQNEIKIELTKPGESGVFDYDFAFGTVSSFKMGVTKTFSYTWYQGFTSNVPGLIVEVPMRPYGYFGATSRGTLNRDITLERRAYQGAFMSFRFYEEPYYFYSGLISTTETILVENFVEFLEEGELSNEYLFQEEFGDKSTDRPTEVSIEGYPYSHYIKGRCY